MKSSFEQIVSKAESLLYKLQEDCNEISFCKNYGQKEVDKFKDKFLADLTYQETCYIMDILYKVKEIEPN